MKNFLTIVATTAIVVGLITLVVTLRTPAKTDSGLSDSSNLQAHFKNTTLNLEVAVSSKKQATGLMNRTELAENSGMLFAFNYESPLTFWMKDTLIPLDIIYLNKNKKVIKIHQSTIPNQITTRYSSKTPAQFVIEMNGGWSEKNNLQIGDKIKF